MTYRVAIRKNATGEVRLYEMPCDWVGDFPWTGGNYSCDCNRAILFAADDEDDECPCGKTAFSCLYAELADGTRIKIDDGGSTAHPGGLQDRAVDDARPHPEEAS